MECQASQSMRCACSFVRSFHFVERLFFRINLFISFKYCYYNHYYTYYRLLVFQVSFLSNCSFFFIEKTKLSTRTRGRCSTVTTAQLCRPASLFSESFRAQMNELKKFVSCNSMNLIARYAPCSNYMIRK